MKFTITKEGTYEVKTKSGEYELNGYSTLNGVRNLRAGDVIKIGDIEDLDGINEIPTRPAIVTK
jgi:hypothetical protein